MKLTNQQRAELKDKYGGLCCYCGIELGDRWHADHLEPVIRIKRHVRDADGCLIKMPNGKFKTKTTMQNPELDIWRNHMPACIKCNNDKSSMKLESWRRVIKSRIKTLNTNPIYASYQKAKRYGLIVETGIDVVFYFERCVSN